jgi:hypothetical protein
MNLADQTAKHSTPCWPSVGRTLSHSIGSR